MQQKVWEELIKAEKELHILKERQSTSALLQDDDDYQFLVSLLLFLRNDVPNRKLSAHKAAASFAWRGSDVIIICINTVLISYVSNSNVNELQALVNQKKRGLSIMTRGLLLIIYLWQNYSHYSKEKVVMQCCSQHFYNI